MPSLFPPNTVLTQGRRNQTVALDPAYGSQITTTLADSVTPALKGAAQYSFSPAGLLLDQEVCSRQLLVGTTAGSVKLSCDGGAVWVETVLDAATTVGAVAIGEASTPDYPHAYAGLATGVLWSYTEPHDNVGTGVWTAIAPSTQSAITAITLPTGGYGACWVGCTDGSLWRYTPSLGLFCVAQLPGAITALCHLQDPGVVYGLCADASVRLFMAMEGGVEAALFCLDKTQSYSGLAAAGTRALAAAGSTSIKWSPDAGASWGALANPAAAPFSAVAVASDDHNEVMALTGAGALYRTIDNGAHWTAATVPGTIAQLEADKHYPGVYYAAGGGALYVTYDRGASWDTVIAAGVTALASGALCCPKNAGNSVSGGAGYGVMDAQSVSGGAGYGVMDAQSVSGGANVSGVVYHLSHGESGSSQTTVVFMLKCGAAPASDTTLFDWDFGAGGYVRMKISSALVISLEYAFNGWVETIAGTAPCLPGVWYQVDHGAGVSALNFWQANFTVLGPGGAPLTTVAGTNRSTGVFLQTFTGIFSMGKSRTSGYLDLPNDGVWKWSKLWVNHTPGSWNVPPPPLSADPTSGDLLVLCRQVLGAVTTINDTSGHDLNLTATSQGAQILLDGPWA